MRQLDTLGFGEIDESIRQALGIKGIRLYSKSNDGQFHLSFSDSGADSDIEIKRQERKLNSNIIAFDGKINGPFYKSGLVSGSPFLVIFYREEPYVE